MRLKSRFFRRPRSPHLAAALALLVAAVLFRYPPDRYAFYPACPIFAHTHLLCPGCGATRAASAILHGRFADAVHDNALFVLLLPFAALYFAANFGRAIQQTSFEWIQPPRAATAAILAATLLFTISRNL